MDNFDEKAYLCALNRIFGFDPKVGLTLLSHFGSAEEIFNNGPDILGPHSRYRGRICGAAVVQAAKELTLLSEKDISFHGITEDGYPPLLKECEDPPIGIYIRSYTPASELWNRPSVSVVGTRDISPYGKEWCRKIVKGLAATTEKPAIVSGLALGVDIEAHRSAIEAGLPTIAVMATGPESIYPYRHRASAQTIYKTPGCALVTDYPPETAPLAIHFLRRNRIIAGLSRATVLVESKIKGGGLMTCGLAFSYNREVYALPGRADDIRSQGCNELIRKKIAEPITSIDSLIDSLRMSSSPRTRTLTDRERLRLHYDRNISEDTLRLMTAIVETVRRRRGITVEELSESLGESYSRTAEMTGILEIDGFIVTDLLQRCSINPKNM